ncbi:uncharacterized protein TM35_000501370, partial [Trypanosoma theileri]
MMSRVLCLLALLLSVVSFCVTAEADSESLPDASDVPCSPERTASGEGETCKPAAGGPLKQPPPSSGAPCPQGETGPQCKNNTTGPEDASTDDCGTSSDRESCPKKEGDTQEHCPPGSGNICPPTPKATAPEQPIKGHSEHGGHTQQDRPDENSIRAADGHSDSGPSKNRETGSVVGTGGVADGRSSPSEAATPAAPSTAGNSDAPSENPQHANNEASEGAPSPTTPSSSSSATTSDGGSNPTSTENDNTSSASESTSNQEGSADNTNTTTTTTTTTSTTLPPELTNNKKGDADSSSSSSISSSVWVRVPLLIVVTLACILVC